MLEREWVVKAAEPLAGTLCLPEGEGPFPTVLMIHGSGALDRNENAPSIQLNVFNTLAEHFAAQGIASYRYDKRGCGKSGGDFYRTGHLDLLADAIACFDTLESLASVNPEQIYLLGHSEGAILAPQVLFARPQAAGGMLLCPFIQPLEQLMLSQAAAAQRELAKRTGWKGGLSRVLVSILIGDLVRFQEKFIQKMRESQADVLRVKMQKKPAKWFREILAVEPKMVFQRIEHPLLLIAAEKDLQCPPEDAQKIARTVQGEVTLHSIENLSHILRRDPNPPTFADYTAQRKRPIDDEVVQRALAWLLRQSRSS